jgi:hypothetical protein
MRRLLLTSLLVALCVALHAQRRLTVVDVETRVPIRGVNVTSRTQRADTTDWQGVIIVPDTCRTLSCSHVKYESRILNLSEVKDTVFLISKLMGLNEVVVIGKGKDEDKLKELKRQLILDPKEAQLIAADPSQGFDVLGLIQSIFKKRKERKQERYRRMLEEY